MAMKVIKNLEKIEENSENFILNFFSTAEFAVGILGVVKML